MTKTLEELLAAGEVESAVIIKDPLLNQFINEQQAEIERLREAMTSALTSLATGPGKDGYAYAVLDAALTTFSGESPE